MNVLRYLLFFTFCYPLLLEAQITFNKRLHFDYPAAVFNSIAVTDTAYYVNGVFADSVYPYRASHLFAKFDLNGNEVFHRIIADTNKTFETFSMPFIKTSDNALLTGGYSKSDTYGMRGMLLKFDSNGNLLDSLYYFSPYYPANPFNVPHDMMLTSDGGVIALNFVENPNGPSNGGITLTKFNKNWEKQWTKLYDTQYEDVPESIIQDGDGFIIGATRSNLNTNFNDFWATTHIFRIDSVGERQWSYLSPGQQLQDAAYGMVKTADGGLVVASGWGTEEDINGAHSLLLWDGYIFKLDQDKKLEWGRKLRESVRPSYNYFNQLIAVSDGSGYVAAGNMETPNFDEVGYDISGWLVKVSPQGDSLWSRLLHHVVSRADFHTFYDVQETPDGGFIMVGQSRDDSPEFEHPRQRAWIVKVDAHGCLVPGCHIKSSTSAPQSRLVVKTYPNPASDYLNIYVRLPAEQTEGRWRVVDVLGRSVRQFDNAGYREVTHLCPVDDLPAGMYVLQYGTDGELWYSASFMVQR